MRATGPSSACTPQKVTPTGANRVKRYDELALHTASPTLALAISVGASAQSPVPAANVPDNLRPSADEFVAMVLAASGVQIYECRQATNQVNTYEWALVASEADLFDASGKEVGKRYAGPHWEAPDGSGIVGTAKQQAAGSQADAIPWVLLAAKSDGAQGVFSKITSVQRVHMVGGAAPRAGCSQAAAGTVARVPYTADYYFLAAKEEASSPLMASANPVVQPRSSYY